MKKPKKKTRPRGAASCPCPGCGGNTRVLTTVRDALAVSRTRECLDQKNCGRRFITHERPA